jgi:hypothetical protein
LFVNVDTTEERFLLLDDTDATDTDVRVKTADGKIDIVHTFKR